MSQKQLIDPKALQSLFHQECKSRLTSFTATLSQAVQDPDCESRWDALHQELDSIANAARIVNDPDTERVSRELATLARKARKQPRLRMQVLELLLRGITAIHCHCLEPQLSESGETLDYRRLDKRLKAFDQDRTEE
ncbi:hypothetical protein [Magnetococcus sp. PR-3]|uniref:hypothetical protein n=1 Tax=Magnetococcus sp. PR-3 TaxID=3120355 RepID=UPI002FCE2E40